MTNEILDEESLDKLSQGIQLFNECEFFEAHEFFEDLWAASSDDTCRDEFLFLVRLAAAGVHLTNENFSALFLFMLARKQLDNGLQTQFINSVTEQLDSLISQLEAAPRD